MKVLCTVLWHLKDLLILESQLDVKWNVTKMTKTILNLVWQISLNSETTFKKSIKLSNTQPSKVLLLSCKIWVLNILYGLRKSLFLEIMTQKTRDSFYFEIISECTNSRKIRWRFVTSLELMVYPFWVL